MEKCTGKISSGREVYQMNRTYRMSELAQQRERESENGIEDEAERKKKTHEPTFNVYYIERKKVQALFDNLETMTAINVYKKPL